MNAKLSIGLLAALGVPILLASAPAQQQASDIPPTESRRTTETFRFVAPASPASGSPVAVSDDKALFVPNPGPLTPVVSPPGAFYGSDYTLPTASTRNAESLLVHRTEELARKLGETKSEADRSQIKTELGELLEKQFSLRQKRHQEEIAALEAKVKKLKDLVEKRQENRREIIAKRLDQILSNAEGLGW